MNCNKIQIKDNNGIAEINIDNTELKRVNKYKVERDTDIVKLTFTITISPKDFILNKN